MLAGKIDGSAMRWPELTEAFEQLLWTGTLKAISQKCLARFRRSVPDQTAFIES